MDAVLALADPEVEVYTPPPMVNSGTFRGHDGYLEWIGSWLDAWDDFAVEVLESELVGEAHVITHAKQRGVGRGSGIPVEMEVWFLNEVRDGRFLALHLYPSHEQALEAAAQREQDARSNGLGFAAWRTPERRRPPPPRLPPAGWYPDPDAPDTRQRYWDGSRWSDSYAPIDTPFVVPHDPPQRARRPTESRFAGIAVVALIEVFNIVADARLVSLLDESDRRRSPSTHPSSRTRATLADDRLVGSSGALVLSGCADLPPLVPPRPLEPPAGSASGRSATEPGWAIGSWFIPIFNLFRPKQIANDLYRVTAGGKLHAEGADQRASGNPLSRWWAVWILGFVVGQIGSFYLTPRMATSLPGSSPSTRSGTSGPTGSAT